MPDQYFTQHPQAGHKLRSLELAYRGHTLTFATDSSTFSPSRVDPGSVLLLSAVGELSGDCADLGCAWGAVGLSLAKANPAARLHLVDINHRALDLAQQNAKENAIDNAFCYAGDGLAAIAAPLEFDCVVTNPPIHAGKAIVFDFFRQAYERLKLGGHLYVVIRKNQGMATAKTNLIGLFGDCQTVKRGGGYHVLFCEKTSGG